MKKMIFSIYINIPDDEVDNPAAFDHHGNQLETDKSFVTKAKFERWKDELLAAHVRYAGVCDAGYALHGPDHHWDAFKNDMRGRYPQLTTYDIINFYKHHLMLHYSKYADAVCYLDFDVIPNTNEDIFEEFDIDNKFAVAESNDKARWGKEISHRQYNTCIRNPASKYWNAYAMLLDAGYSKEEADTDVFNTGIMCASSSVIRKLDYFHDFDLIMSDMKYLKSDTSLFHPNVVRSFNYDNETVFAFKRVVNDVDIDFLDSDWHHDVVDDEPYTLSAKMLHVINKRFEWFEDILCQNR